MLPVKLAEAKRTGSALARHQINRRVFASSINLDVEFQPIALSKIAHARTFDRTDMHKCIGLAIITGDEAEALHGIEELDRSGRLLASQLALRGFCCGFALGHRDHIADHDQIGRRDLAAAIDQSEFKLLTFGQSFKASPLNRADVHEHIFSAIIALDEAEAFLGVEELYDAFAFANDLSRHTSAAASAATRAAKAAAAGTAAAITAAAEAAAITKTASPGRTATKPVAATTTGCRKGIKPFFAETITLVAPAATTSSIKTHKTERTFLRPN